MTPQTMPRPDVDDDPDTHATVVTRTTSTRGTICIACAPSARERALEVTVRDGARCFTGTLRDDDARAPYDHYFDIAACALRDPRRARVAETFTFTLDDVDGDTRATELAWSFREEDYNLKFGAATTVEDEIPSTPDEDFIDGFECTRVGVLTLHAREDDGGDMISIARGYERAREMVMTLEEDGAALREASRRATARAEEATTAKARVQEECARRFVALLNTKKSELQRARDALEAADVEIETLRSRLERGGGGLATTTTAAAATGAALDDDDDDVDDDDDDDEKYATDDENVPTQRGERVSMRKKFARETQTQSQAPSQAARRKRGGGETASSSQQHTQSQPTKSKAKRAKNKSFLADALLDCLDTA